MSVDDCVLNPIIMLRNFLLSVSVMLTVKLREFECMHAVPVGKIRDDVFSHGMGQRESEFGMDY
ncbi:hypothetical protein CDL15_Pgr019082 [Punica granatum]|nr:hypothetical protein CDL15_Pgr019082 [Punica granatum]